jgi:hypothetical protein
MPWLSDCDVRRLLKAAVLAAGGALDVSDVALLRAHTSDLTVWRLPAEGGTRLTCVDPSAPLAVEVREVADVPRLSGPAA